MVEIKAHEYASLVRRESLPYPIVVLFGPDRGLVSERAAELAGKTNIDLKDDFSVVRLDANEIGNNPSALLDVANSVSLFGGDRLVWIRGANNEKGIVDALRQLANQGLPATRILIEAGDLKKNAALRKAAAEIKLAVSIPCYSDDIQAIQGLIDEELKTAGLKIQNDARQRLISMLGGDRIASRGELRKLALYCHDTGMVSDDDVINAIGDVAALSVDDAVDAVLAGDLKKLDQALNRIENSKMSVFLVLRGIIQQFTLMDIMRAEMENDGRQLATVMSGRGRAIHFKRKPVFQAALQNWRLSAIRGELKRLEQAVFQTRNRPSIEMATARNALMRTCLVSARLAGRRPIRS